MKKTVPVIIILIIAVVLGAPYITGKVAETETMKIVDVLNQDSELYGRTEIVSYERGIRNTRAKYQYIPSSALANMLQTAQVIEFGCESNHGLIGIDYRCFLEGENAYSKFVKEQLGGKDPFSMHGSVSAFSGLRQTLELEAIEGFMLGQDEIDIPKMLLSVNTNGDMTSFDIDGGSDAFSFSNAGTRFEFGEMSLNADLKSIGTMLFTGPSTLSFNKISVNSTNEQFTLNNFLFSSLNKEKGDNLDSKGSFKVDSITTNNSPIKSIENAEMIIEVNGVDTAAFSEYQVFSMNLQKQALSAMGSGKDSQVDPNTMLQLLPIIERMLKPGLEMNVDVNAKINGDDTLFKLKLSLLETLTFGQMAAFLSDPEQAIKRFNIDIETRIAQPLLELQPTAAAMIANSPLILKADNSYHFQLSSGKKIELNGKNITFNELQAMVFGSLGF